MNKQILDKINQYLSNQCYNEIAIFRNEDGKYELFNKYYISSDNTRFTVNIKYGSEIKKFNSLKHAVAWCTFENRKKYKQSARVEYLDTVLSGSMANIEVQKNLIHKTKNTDQKLVYLAKLSAETSRKQQLDIEMAELINEVKVWQSKKFAKMINKR